MRNFFVDSTLAPATATIIVALSLCRRAFSTSFGFSGYVSFSKLKRFSDNPLCPRACYFHAAMAEAIDLEVDGMILFEPLDPVVAAIHGRADTLTKLGVHWGFSDWLAWSWSAKICLRMIFDANVVDPYVLFAPPEITAVTASWGRVIYIVLSKCAGGQMSTTFGDVLTNSSFNHVLHAKVLHDVSEDEGPCEFDLAMFVRACVQ